MVENAEGSLVITACVETGGIAALGLCESFLSFNTGTQPTNLPVMTFTQNRDAVNGRVQFGAFAPSDGAGSISIDGALRLTFNAAPATVFFGDPVRRLRFTAWVARADVPGTITATFRIEVIADGITGVVLVDMRLRNSFRVSS